ncbi:MAG TPA: succinate dehydrogenase [Candidatus Dormibacteraeota bacterium]|jgi:hypothetical protein|nr:succinate dehydrogenase [Candidatus Dormibacteraeota bacterium]
MTVSSTEFAAAPRGSADHAAGLGTIARLQRDKPWWLLPVTVVVVLGSFIVYSAWTATVGHGDASIAGNPPYLSPFYSPTWLAGHVPVFPALLCLLVPIGFRGTCYYYRKAYHRSFLLDPPACSVAEPRHRAYHGETRFPLVLNNLHRFTMYLAVAYVFILGYDAVNAFSLGGHLYLGLGTAIMVVNVILIAAYTFSCHSLRHFVGGGMDCYSCVRFGKPRHRIWQAVTRLNVRHPMWAWVSMFSVWSVDVYIRILGAGWFTDPHHIF